MSALEILKELRVKLADESAWWQGSWFFGLHHFRDGAAANSTAAATDCPACLGGWLARITHAQLWVIGSGQSDKQFWAIVERLQTAMEQRFYEPDLDTSPPDLFDWNDQPDTEHKHILQVIDTAISNEQHRLGL